MTKCKLSKLCTFVMSYIDICLFVHIYTGVQKTFKKVHQSYRILRVKIFGNYIPKFPSSYNSVSSFKYSPHLQADIKCRVLGSPPKTCPVMHCPALHICGQSNYLICSQDRRQLPDPAFWATQKRRPESWTGRQVCQVQRCGLDKAV